MAESLSFTFYTFSLAGVPDEDRWKQTGIADTFFEDCDSARQALLASINDIEGDAQMTAPRMNLERVQTVDICRSSILNLLNNGPGSFIQKYEVIESIDPRGITADS